MKKTFIFALLLSIGFALFSQPLCFPKIRDYDAQIMDNNGNIILVKMEFGGELMDVFDEDKKLNFYYTVLSQGGEIVIDTMLYFDWPDWHYDFIDCFATYKNQSMDGFPEYPHERDSMNCSVYLLFDSRDTTVIGYHLSGDRKYAYEIQIDKNGNCEYILYDFDKYAINGAYWGDKSKSAALYTLELKTKHRDLQFLSRTKYCTSFKDSVQLNDFPVYLRKKTNDPGDKSDLYYPPPPDWEIVEKRWSIDLNGYYKINSDKPMLQIIENTLYLTVFNTDGRSCPEYGYDLSPVVYAIDLKKGKIIWQKTIEYYEKY
jgi:hypothetical protein